MSDLVRCAVKCDNGMAVDIDGCGVWCRVLRVVAKRSDPRNVALRLNKVGGGTPESPLHTFLVFDSTPILILLFYL